MVGLLLLVGQIRSLSVQLGLNIKIF